MFNRHPTSFMVDGGTWSGDVAILSVRWNRHNENDMVSSIIEVTGRSKDGKSVVALVHGFSPGVEISIPGVCKDPEDLPDDIEDRLRKVRELKQVIDISTPRVKWTDLGEKKHWWVTVEQPFVVPKLRERLSDRWNLSSADIPFSNRLFLDEDLGPHVNLTGEILHHKEKPGNIENIVAAGGSGIYPVDIVIKCERKGLVEIEPFQAPWVIFSFDLETSIENDRILCAAATIETLEPELEEPIQEIHTFSGDEIQIMKDLTELLRSRDPDIITGYNVDNFDLPRLNERMEFHYHSTEIERRSELFGWGRVAMNEDEYKRNRQGLIPKRANTRAWILAGRVVMDAWWQARSALRPRRETLKFVAELLFPDRDELHKMDVDASRMDEEWANRPEVVLEYCARDSALPLQILRSIQATRRKEAIAAVAKVPFETAANGTTSQLLDSLVIRLAESKDVAVPLTGSAAKKEGQIPGGYVHDVEAGMHPWIAVLDFKSMYPSIMIGNNICHTTRIDISHPIQPTEDELVHISPTGARFRNKNSREGLVPFLLRDLMSQRDYHKLQMKLAQENEHQAKIAFHDQMQYAVKIMMNSFYGVFASEFYRFTHHDLGTSITAWARRNIKGIIQKLEKEGHHVVYSDTDSIFVSVPVEENSPTAPPDEKGELKDKWDSAMKEMIRFGNETAQRFSEEGAVLEFETGMSAFFSHGAKKRYVGRVVWPKDDLMIKGYETQRTDSFLALTKGMQRIFELVLDGDESAAINLAKEQIAKVKRSEVPAEDLVISKLCKGKQMKDGSIDFTKDYANPNGQAQVRAARKRIKRNLPFTPGMKIAYVVTDASQRPMVVEPWNEAEEDGGIKSYDSIFYAERLATAFGRVAEAFGWSADELMKGNRQSSLFSF